jgi:restriction system protein
LYKSVVAQVTVRTLHGLFEADRDGLVETVVFNGHVETINAATGRTERPCLVTLRTTRDVFLERDFSRIDPEACLLDLSASLSDSAVSRRWVDCVAFDNRAIFGGKVIIQAKRYKNTGPVSAVRDLFGSVHNEGASKGILVTTSGYGKASLTSPGTSRIYRVEPP